MLKSVFLEISCPKNPYGLMILFDDCTFAKKININCYSSKFYFCTSTNKLKIVARYGNQTVFKTIYLGCEPCQKVCAKFMFNTQIFQNVVGVISLTDANFGFPITNAVLKFSK